MKLIHISQRAIPHCPSFSNSCSTSLLTKQGLTFTHATLYNHSLEAPEEPNNGGVLLVRDNCKIDLELVLEGCPPFNFGGLLLPHTECQLDSRLNYLFLILSPNEGDRKFRTDLKPSDVVTVYLKAGTQMKMYFELIPLKAYVVYCM